MSKQLPLAKQGIRLQKLWLCFTVFAVLLTRFFVYGHIATPIAKAIYTTCCVAVAVAAVFLYRLDTADDLKPARENMPEIPPSFGSAFASQVMLIFLALGLAEGIWVMRSESLWMILIVPINAVWVLGFYRTSLTAKLKNKAKTVS